MDAPVTVGEYESDRLRLAHLMAVAAMIRLGIDAENAVAVINLNRPAEILEVWGSYADAIRDARTAMERNGVGGFLVL
jgi:hypothetical protein